MRHVGRQQSRAVGVHIRARGELLLLIGRCISKNPGPGTVNSRYCYGQMGSREAAYTSVAVSHVCANATDIMASIAFGPANYGAYSNCYQPPLKHGSLLRAPFAVFTPLRLPCQQRL